MRRLAVIIAKAGNVMEQAGIVSEVQHLLDQLEAFIDSGRRLPWGRQILLDGDALRANLDHLRHALPEEMRQAQWVIQERDRIIQETGQEADQMLSQALDRAHQMAQDSAVVKEAEIRAREIVGLAEERAREIHQGALAYAEELFAQVEKQLDELANAVRRDRTALKPPVAAVNQ